MLVDKGRGDVRRLEEENREVKRRNQKLEESFIEHLTQTSLNLQQTLKHQPERTKNSSLYLNETPIRSQSRGRERIHSPDEDEDPEKSQLCDQKHSDYVQVNALKGKLKHANAKIVQLLH